MPLLTLPKFVNRCTSGFCSHVQQDANYIVGERKKQCSPSRVIQGLRRPVKPTVGANEWTKSVEEPSMAVQFLLVLFLQTEDDLDWTWSRRDLASVCDDDLRCVSTKRSNLATG